MNFEIGDLVRVKSPSKYYEPWLQNTVGRVIKIHKNNIECDWVGLGINYIVSSNEVILLERRPKNVIMFKQRGD